MLPKRKSSSVQRRSSETQRKPVFVIPKEPTDAEAIVAELQSKVTKPGGYVATAILAIPAALIAGKVIGLPDEASFLLGAGAAAVSGLYAYELSEEHKKYNELRGFAKLKDNLGRALNDLNHPND